MTSDDKITPADRLSIERQLAIALPAMEQERANLSVEILALPTVDVRGAAFLERIYDVYMGEFIDFVRRCRGGLEPYSFRYQVAEDVATPSNPHVLNVCHRNMMTKEDVPIAQFAVVHLLNDSTYPLHQMPVGELDPDLSRKIAKSMASINDLYLEHLEEQNLFRSTAAHLFYLPYTAVIGSLIKTEEAGTFCHETVVNPPPHLTAEELFLPYEFSFNDEDDDPAERCIVVRLGQRSIQSTALAVEARFNLDGLRRAVMAEKALGESLPPSPVRH